MPLSDLLHVLAPLVTNCRGFHEAWESAPSPDASDALSGRWDGSWKSDANGAHGPLRCVVTRLDADRWRATFHATFGRILKACYETEFVASGARFQGTSDLGTFGGGVYEYTVDINADEFVAAFRSRTDRGTFHMRRVR
jgi:hypothetical protein